MKTCDDCLRLYVAMNPTVADASLKLDCEYDEKHPYRNGAAEFCPDILDIREPYPAGPPLGG